MNRFRSKKKVNEAAAASTPDLTKHDDTPPVPSLKSSKTFRLGGWKNTKEEPEPKVELDLSTALPSTDDFRTSLLMNGLSARFSMLREADDPNSKMGKASDDSVLFSSRHSRLDFNFQPNGLTDIAEVQSIRSTIRAPFGHNGASGARASLDGYGTDDDSTHTGSIMSRAKPGEGNNLFGGRQKVYKIPTKGTASMKNLGESGGSGMSGRVLYEDDVSKSAFQKLREKERQQRQEELEAAEAQEQLEQSPRADSPPLSGYNRNRETSSTTSSGPLNARSSTAATSVTSQGRSSENGSSYANAPAVPGAPGIERSMTKGRRLYETGLDQHLHDQQHSAMSRIDSLTRQRTYGASTPPLSLSTPTSMTGMHEKFERSSIRVQNEQPTVPGASPTPVAALSSFDFGVKPLSSEPQRKQSLIGVSPPLSPPMSDVDDHSSLHIQPNDHGKATALGAFQKPTQPYDDKKWSQRQMQLQQGKETPPPRRNAPPAAFMPAKLTTRTDTSSSQDTASVRSGSAASVHREPTSPLARMKEQQPVKEEVSAPEAPAINMGAFLASPDPSSVGSPEFGNDSVGQPWGQPIAALPSGPPSHALPSRPVQDNHIPLRTQPQPIKTDIQEEEAVSNMSGFSFQSENRAPSPIEDAVSSPIDSPTLGPTSGLSGMVRQHMRSDSEVSSYGQSSPELTKDFSSNPLESITQNAQSNHSGNSWEVNDWDQDIDPKTPYGAPISTQTPLAPISGNIEQPNQANQIPAKASWEKELESKHSRTASTDTQQERQDFAAELAARRKRVQENMKNMATAESRSTSPVPNLDWSKETSRLRNNPLGILKAKTSGESLVSRAKENLIKSSGNASINAPPVSKKAMHDDNQWRQEEEEMLRGIVKGPKVPAPQAASSTKSFREQRRDAQRERERQVAERKAALKQERGGPTSTSPDAPIQQDPRQQQPGRGPMSQARAPSQASSYESSGQPFRPNPDQRGPPVSQAPAFKPRDPSRERRPSVQTQAFPAYSESSEPRHPGPPPAMSTQRRPSVQTQAFPVYSESPEPRHPGPPPAMSTQRRPSATPYQARAPSRTDTHSYGTPQQSRPGSRAARERSGSNEPASRPGSRTARYRDEPSHVLSEVNGILTTGAYENMAPARVPTRSPVAPSLASQPESDASSPAGMTPNGRARSASKSTPGGYFDVQKLKPLQTDVMEIGLSPRPSPVTPYSANTTPSLSLPSPNGAATTPTNAFQSQKESQREKAARKKSINKWDISEPKLMSATSRIDTVDLPPGASLKNGAETAPPVPPINPRRRQTRTATIFGSVFSGKGPGDDPMPPTPTQQQYPDEDYSTFSADEADPKPSKPQRLRKISSEGGNMSGRAAQLQQHAAGNYSSRSSSPPKGTVYESREPSPPAPVEGAMF